jgi:hypothetical protein
MVLDTSNKASTRSAASTRGHPNPTTTPRAQLLSGHGSNPRNIRFSFPSHLQKFTRASSPSRASRAKSPPARRLPPNLAARFQLLASSGLRPAPADPRCHASAAGTRRRLQAGPRCCRHAGGPTVPRLNRRTHGATAQPAAGATPQPPGRVPPAAASCGLGSRLHARRLWATAASASAPASMRAAAASCGLGLLRRCGRLRARLHAGPPQPPVRPIPDAGTRLQAQRSGLQHQRSKWQPGIADTLAVAATVRITTIFC